MAAGQSPDVAVAAGEAYRVCAPAAAGSRVSAIAAPRAGRSRGSRDIGVVLGRNPVRLKRRSDIRPMCEHVFALIVCVQIPRFELAIAAGGREALAAGPVALAPEAGREQLIGQASAAAEAYGVRAGLRLGGAVGRRPAPRPLPPGPAGGAAEWERLPALAGGGGAAAR